MKLCINFLAKECSDSDHLPFTWADARNIEKEYPEPSFLFPLPLLPEETKGNRTQGKDRTAPAMDNTYFKKQGAIVSLMRLAAPAEVKRELTIDRLIGSALMGIFDIDGTEVLSFVICVLDSALTVDVLFQRRRTALPKDITPWFWFWRLCFL